MAKLVFDQKWSNSIFAWVDLRRDKFYNTQDMKGVTSLDEDWVVINQMIKHYKHGFAEFQII